MSKEQALLELKFKLKTEDCNEAYFLNQLNYALSRKEYACAKDYVEKLVNCQIEQSLLVKQIQSTKEAIELDSRMDIL